MERSSGGKHCGVGGWRKRQVLSFVSESEIWNENLSISGCYQAIVEGINGSEEPESVVERVGRGAVYSQIEVCHCGSTFATES